ncbi:MAG: hypothetical protein KGJ43_06810 [Acidobacteriota bacterium]|nr:hypothetical protein [Acidobacteriota bacterium]
MSSRGRVAPSIGRGEHGDRFAALVDDDGRPPAAVLRRREAAAAARRRRNALADVLAGIAIGLVVWLLGFGLAPMGLLALVVLVLCARSYRGSRRWARRRRRTPGLTR